MASTRDGGCGVSMKPIDPSDNLGDGSSIDAQMRRLPGDGIDRWFRVIFDGSPNIRRHLLHENWMIESRWHL